MIENQHIAKPVLIRTFGSDSIELSKSQSHQSSTVIIGWFVDLISQTIRPSDHAIDKLFYSFSSFDIDVAQPLSTIQSLPGLAERYSHGILVMRVFVHP